MDLAAKAFNGQVVYLIVKHRSFRVEFWRFSNNPRCFKRETINQSTLQLIHTSIVIGVRFLAHQHRHRSFKVGWAQEWDEFVVLSRFYFYFHHF